MLSPTAEKIHKLKYSLKGEEDWKQTCLRVATHVSSIEKEQEEWAGKFFQMMYYKAFLPGGRVLANAGTKIKNLNNCFVLPVEDSRESIYQTLKDAAEIFAWGGGVGYNFSNIREEGAPVKTTGGDASGPLSFMSLFDQTGEVISQASRRGAQIGLLDCDHPDIEKFIDFKATLNSRNKRLLSEYYRNLEVAELDRRRKGYFNVLEKTLQDDQLTHFNISVSLTDEFMEAVASDSAWELISRVDGIPNKMIQARELLTLIAEKAWESGDPGVFFTDRANMDNMVKYLGLLEATNPCGEIPLLPYEPCCLGSINLVSIYDEDSGEINFPFLEELVRASVRFLDNVQELSQTSVEQVNNWSKGLRRLGLGVMGWADLLALLDVPYDSDDALDLAEYLSWFISFFSWLESISLSQERGVFPLYDPEEADLEVVFKSLQAAYVPHQFDLDDVRKTGTRNVAITSIAPTGTISLISGVNSSIEPFFALAYKRNITQGIGNEAKDFVIEINPILLKKLKEEDFSDKEIEEIKNYILKNGTISDHPKIFDHIKSVFRTSLEIDFTAHIKMQAAWQKYVDNAISKTINMKNNATPEDIFKAYFLMWEAGLKGGTIYRDNSKSFQILETGVEE
jgi:ribonucleoside-diphosphate reductase alpha chain